MAVMGSSDLTAVYGSEFGARMFTLSGMSRCFQPVTERFGEPFKL